LRGRCSRRRGARRERQFIIQSDTLVSTIPINYHDGERGSILNRTSSFNPRALCRFPKEILSPPREWVERGYNVQRWTNMPHGGHFAAAEEPDLLAEDIRMFFRGLRK